MSELSEFRKEKDEFFKYHPHAPLTPEQRTSFKGLKYYLENPRLRYEVDVQEHSKKEIVEMITSTGTLQKYRRYGQFEFQVEGQTHILQVYRDLEGGHFFLPFIDTTAGQETYETGRYLEIERLSNGKYQVDFNYAYNPYCAYNDYWTCPIPPAENRLKVRIQAGEKKYK
ncbi:MAG: DUF1684 domain-containing protein [Chloroflexi bacterium]|nr:DUF1684 domain-containing protein [Chloroflexota bacterium]